MATMIKEKRKDKRKLKQKDPSKTNITSNTLRAEIVPIASTSTDIVELEDNIRFEFPELQNIAKEIKNLDKKTVKEIEKEDENQTEEVIKESKVFLSEVPKTSTISESINQNLQVETAIVQEQLFPSAPVFHEPETVSSNVGNEFVKEVEIPKLSCMPLEEAIRIFGGREIAEVRALSERQETIVEAGPKNDPDNPLVDLLSTFRSSLIAVERERHRISCGYIEEEKTRATLWKVEKRSVSISEKCCCGNNVSLRASYDVAKLQRERMPAARLRLESLMREVQETYCHHQHSALLAHYDIDELLSEIVNNTKDRVREALALMFQAMKLSDGAPDSFAEALQRWAGILAAALLDTQDMGHLLFLMHYLFRQTRSVRWASSVVYVRVWDARSVAALLVLLELMLTRPSLETALECTEEVEAWEEVDEGGEGGAVGEGRLRERDLLALLESLPLRDMVARLVMFSRQDINQETEDNWRDSSGGHGVLKACCGARTLLQVFQCAAHTHGTYTRLHAHLQNVSVVLLTALAALHQHCRSSYARDLEERISVELEACFAAGLNLLGDNIHRLPAALLREHVAKEYCDALINGLHETTPLKVSSLSVCVSVHSCAVRVRALALAATQRAHDHNLASSVVQFLFQTGLKPGPVRCKGGCDAVCRELMPQLLAAHRDQHTTVFYMLADLEDASPRLPPAVRASWWRPSPSTLVPLLQHWSRRRPARLQHLLLALDYTPHAGLSLDTQLAIGSWLCLRDEAPEWAWQVLRKLRVHRSQWGLPLEAPSHEPRDLLSKAFALMAGDWGHCIPLVCGPGADALLQLAQRRPLDALYCLGPLMVVMAQSPESVSLTPRFTEILTAILNHGVSLVQYALRRRPPGEEALRRLLTEQLRDSWRGRSALLSSWLHALWSGGLPPPARALADHAAALSRHWHALDRHAAALLQSEDAEAHISRVVSEAASCPVLCEAVLRALLAREMGSNLHPALLHELVRQRTAGERIHVDNALKTVGWSPSPMLCVYGCARAVLRVGPQHPAHVLLARLLLHVYLQRYGSDSAPVGTLFFSGLIQSRLYLLQIKEKLREFATYHHEQALSLKEYKNTTKEKSLITIEKVSPKVDNDLFPTLKISDFISNLSSCEERKEIIGSEDSTSEVEIKEDGDRFHLICYHTAVEQLCRQYALWLDEGNKVQARPHHADIANILSEQALEAAWRDYLKKTVSTPSPSPLPSPSSSLPPSQEHLSHFERAVESIRSINNGSKNKLCTATLPEPLHESYFKNGHMLYELIDNRINQLKKSNDEWCMEVSRLSSLDGRLWELVAALRVPRVLPAVRQPCSQCNNDIVVTISEEEWVVSSGAAQGIIENRFSARTGMRALARPRPDAARSAALLQAAARRVRSPPLALGVCHRAWAAVPGLERYGPGADALASLVESLVTKFISRDIETSLRLLEAWGADVGVSGPRADGGPGALRRRLCGALVGEARREHRARMYTAVLRLPLAPHVAFSYLSKFDLHNWADTVDSSERNEILEAIVNAAERMGPTPDDEHSVLLEQLGIHCQSAVRGAELCSHVSRVMSGIARRLLPPQLARHLPAAVRACTHLHHDQLGHLLRDIGSMWWAARTARGAVAAADRALFSLYATHAGDALYALTHAFVDSAVRCSYTPERVSWYAWSAATESWSAWLAPHVAPPLLPQHTTDQHNLTTKFADTVVLIMHRCPGCEEHLLRHIWEWTVQTYLTMEPSWPAECRLPMATLLTVLADLPWHLQWFHVSCLPLALQACSLPREAVVQWCSATLQGVGAHSWLRGVEDHQVAPALDALLALFTSRHLVLPQESYNQVALLPWLRLPVPALDAALQRYFQEHHSPTEPYHEKPQFKALLSASLLLPPSPPGPSDPRVSERRACAVSQWVRAACSPGLGTHVRGHTERALHVLTDLAPHMEQSEGELEELLSRSIVIMCIEPAAAAALPVWVRRVQSSPPRVRRACVSAVGSLTVLEYFAPLADCVTRAELRDPEGGGWSSLVSRWSNCAWWAPEALVRRGRAHAAYALHRAGARGLAGVFTALMGGSVNLSENEEIVGVWICVACRVMQQQASDADEALDAREELADESETRRREDTRRPIEAGPEPEGEERGACAGAAQALLTRWAQHRRSLLQLVALQAADDCPTTRLQLLCRLALYVVSPSEATYSSYASACASVPCVPCVLSAPEPRVLPRTAISLYPQHEAYFKDELELAAHSK